ncbi:MAG: ABC transporter substrate-binding protein [Saprospiraceae bacterium]|nr:MAG: ABC transporter substrate-binding protein [Saprospiraceae bacterium]
MKDNLPLGILRKTILCLVAVSFATISWSQLGASEERGQDIFRKGTSPSGQKIVALMSGAEVPASVLPCSSCHGLDGKGRPEGGVSPSNITWNALTKGYNGKRSNGRTHNAYTSTTLKRAISMGLDPAGNTLNSTMPHYQMSQQDMQDLVDYLKVLGQESVPGLTDSTLLIGTLLRPEPQLDEMNQVVSEIIHAYFTEINQQGGIFNRQLAFEPTQNEPLKQPAFALVSSWLDQQQDLIPPGTPVVGGMAQFPETDLAKNRQLFYLLPGLDQQAETLGRQVKGGKIALIYESDTLRGELIEAFKKGVRTANVKEIIEFKTTDYPPEDLAGILRKQQINQVFLLGNAAFEKDLCDQLGIHDSPPELFLLGSFTTLNIYELPAVWQGKIILAYPQWMSSASDKGKAMIRYLQQKYNLSDRYQQSQWAALSGAILLVDALKKVGRDLSREQLVEALENTYRLETGLLPPISYSANRRIGSEQVFLVKYLGVERGLVLTE